MVVNPVLVLQVLTGASLFFGHGLGKLRNPGKTVAWFKKQGYGVLGGAFAILVEGVASVLLVLGIYPRIMAGLIMLVMLGAMTHHWRGKDAFRDGWETAFLYFIASLVIIIGGVSPWGFVL